MRILAAALIAALALAGAASAETIELKNGDKLEGVTVLEQNELVTVVEHPVLGRLEIPTADIEPPEEEKVRPGVFGTRFLEGWTKSLSAGLGGSSGVTKETNFNVGLGLNNETERHRDAFTAQYFFASADGDTSQDEFQANHLHDFLFTDSKWLAYIGGSYRYDRFQDWDARLVGSAGAGYDFLKDDVRRLTGRLGPGFTFTVGDRRGTRASTPGDTRFRPDPVRQDFNGFASLEFVWAIADGVDFNSDASYFPVLNDLPEFRAISHAELKIALSVIEGLSFKLGGSYEYDSQNVEQNDRQYYGALAYEF